MASTYRPWQYANRQVVRQRKVRDFRNNAAVYEENAPPAAPSPVQQAASALDETAAPKKKGGGGLFGKLKDVGGDILEGAKTAGEIALSGEKLQDALGINTEYMDTLRSKGLAGKAAAYALDTATSPLTIATVGAGGWVGAGLRGATAGTKLATAGRIGAALAEPALSGNVARRAIAEVGAGVGAGLASEYAGDALEGAPRPVRTLGALAAGVAGGAAGLNAGRIYKAGMGPQGAAVRGLEALQGRQGMGPAIGMGVEAVDDAAGVPRPAMPPLDKSSDEAILGIEPGRTHSPADIKKAYRERMRSYHPDTNAGETATEDAAAINDAFERMIRKEPSLDAGAPVPPVPGREAGARKDANGARDMFNTVGRAEEIGREQAFQQSGRGKLDQGIRNATARVGGVTDQNYVRDTEVAPFVVRERNRIDNMIGSYEGVADQMWGAVEDSGVRIAMDEDGVYRVAGIDDGAGGLVPFGTKRKAPTFGDMVELSSPEGREAYRSLTPQQREAVDALADFNADLNGNIRFHGGSVPLDEAIEGAYFPRMVLGRDGVRKPRMGTGGRRLGSKGSFERARTMELSMEEGIDAGVDYADPRTAYRAMVRAKLKAASDDYMVSRLKPLGMTAKQAKKAGVDLLVDRRAISPDIAPGLTGRYFEPDVADRIEGALAGTKAANIPLVSALNATLTPFRASGDISAVGQQGAALWFRHPVKAATGAAKVIRSSTGDPAVYREMMEEEAKRGPGVRLLVEHGLHVTADDLPDEFAFTTKLGKAPVVGKVFQFSNDAFSRYLNYSRLVFANDAYELALRKAAAEGWEPEQIRTELQGAMNSVNRMSGWTGRKPTSVESLGTFAPRYLSSAIEQIAAAVSRGGMEGTIARQHLSRMLVGGLLMGYATNKLRGEETGTDFWDPRSYNFGRMKNVGGVDISLFGQYDTLMRYAAQLAGGTQASGLDMNKPEIPETVGRLARSKASPAVGILWDLLAGETYRGEPLTLDIVNDPGGVAKTALHEAQGSLPFGLQNAAEGVTARVAAEGLTAGAVASGIAPALIGATGVSNSPLTPTERRNRAREEAAREMFGSSYEDLAGEDKAKVNESDKVSRYQGQADRNTLTQDTDRSKYTKATLDARNKIAALSDELNSKTISGNEWREEYRKIQAELRGARSVLKIEGLSEGEVDGWFKLYEDYTMPSGRIDFEGLEEAQTGYIAKHPDVEEKILKAVGVNDNATVRDYRKAREQAQRYYDIPAYRGMTIEQSRDASTVIKIADDMVAFGQARNRRAAYAIIARQAPEAVKLARRAERAQSNPERKKFRRDPANREFAIFYSDVKTAS